MKEHPCRHRSPPARSFTLIELLAVVTIIVLLAGLVLGIAHYTDYHARVGEAKAVVALVSGACEAFRADYGRYPTSTQYRGSSRLHGWMVIWTWEARNGATLYQQLCGSGGQYLRLPPAQVRPISVPPFEAPYCNTTGTVDCARGINQQGYYPNYEFPVCVIDPWQSPYNYFCTYPPIPTNTQISIPSSCSYSCCDTNGQVVPCTATWNVTTRYGGQRNLASFDFWSYGPNKENNEGEKDDIGFFR